MGTRLNQKITKRTVDLLEPDGAKELRLWDTEIKGFCVRIKPSGRKVYSVTYRHRGRFRWYTIGKHGDPWTPEQARQRAQEVLGDVARGIDTATAEKEETTKGMTVASLIDLYLSQGPIDRPNKRASSWANDKSYLNNHARRLLGNRLIDELKPADLARFQYDVVSGKSARPKKNGRGRPTTGGVGAASHAIRSLSAALGWAAERDFIQANPCDRVRKMADGFRERYLSKEEARRLFKAIDELHKEDEIVQSHVDCIELLSYTGARRGEICALKWTEVDFEQAILILPPLRHKTGGQNQPKVIPLSAGSVEILKRRREQAKNKSLFVFESPNSRAGHVTNLRHTWEKITRKAELDDFRIHDFRHAYASFAINSGQSLKMIGANLGHKKMSTTERYAHLLVDARRSVAEGIQDIYDELRK